MYTSLLPGPFVPYYVAWLEFCHGAVISRGQAAGVDNASTQSARSPDPVAGMDVCDVRPDRFGSMREGRAVFQVDRNEGARCRAFYNTYLASPIVRTTLEVDRLSSSELPIVVTSSLS
jgi:hypothetical protein